MLLDILAGSEDFRQLLWYCLHLSEILGCFKFMDLQWRLNLSHISVDPAVKPNSSQGVHMSIFAPIESSMTILSLSPMSMTNIIFETGSSHLTSCVHQRKSITASVHSTSWDTVLELSYVLCLRFMGGREQ